MSQLRQTLHAEREESPAPLRLITLGGCHLEGAPKPSPAGLTAGRPLGVLLYLAMHPGRPILRETLVQLFWGDRPTDVGRRVLRQALYIVRKGLPPGVLITESESISLDGGPVVDAVCLDQAVREGRFEEALALYRGGFLQGFSIRGAVAFQHWVDGERIRLNRLISQATMGQVDEALARGAWDDALEMLDRLLADDLMELAPRIRRAEVLDLADRHVEAIIEAEAIERCFGQEDDALSEAAQAVLRRIHERTPSRHRVGSEDPQETALREPSLFGREDEFKHLLHAWRSTIPGTGVVALIQGDPGIGKTRLIQEVLRTAELEGATILRGKSYELQDGLLYGALVDLMRQAVDAPGFAGVSETWIAELARLLPELEERYPAIRKERANEALPGRRRFHEAVAQVFEALAFEAPLICVLDDLHWADEATLELVHYLSRRLCATPILIVAGIRPGEATEALRRLERVLVDEHGGVRIELGPLDRSCTDAVVRSMGGGDLPIPTELGDLLWDASEGNPFFVVATTRALEEQGAIKVLKNGWWVDPNLKGDLPLLQAHALFRSQLELLAGPLRTMLEAAVIIGRQFTPELLGEITRLPAEVVADALDELKRRRILVCRVEGERTLCDFAHDRVRDAIYEGITTERRVELHRRIAHATADGEGLNACLLARHHALAGNRTEAFHHALTGAEWARGVFAYGGEWELLELAAANAPNDRTRKQIQSRLNELERVPLQDSSLPSAKRPPRGVMRRKRKRTLAAVVTPLVLVGAWLSVVGVARGSRVTDLPPLPEGILLYVSDSDWEGYAVLDPEQPSRPPIRLTPEQFQPSDFQDPSGRKFLSPDRRLVAFYAGRDGQPPDIYVERRDGTGVRRITTDPEDDAMPDWLPDGSGLLFRTLRGRTGSNYGFSLAVASVDGGDVRLLTNGPWSDVQVRISPDGTRLAVVRELGGSISLWIMNSDGSGGRKIAEDLDGLGALSWSPTGPLVLVHAESASSAGGSGLFVTDVDRAVTMELEAARGLTGLAVWSPDGSAIYFVRSVDGNAEIFAIRPDGTRLRRLTFTRESELILAYVGTRQPYLDRIAILYGTGDTIVVPVGDIIDVTAAMWSSDGGLLQDLDPEWRCLDSSVCQASEGGTIHGTGSGLTELVASVGGWRADTVFVRVVDTKPRRALSESWEHGIDSTIWLSFGDPRPEVGEDLGRGGSFGLLPNGDAKYNSGVLTRASFDRTRGLTITFWAKGEFDTPMPSWQGFGVAVTATLPESSAGDVSIPHQLSIGVGRPEMEAPVTIRFAGFSLEASPAWDPEEWHQYALQLLPNLDAELWIDGRRVFTARGATPSVPFLHVMLQGRASHAPVVYDDVEVWEGLRWR